MFGMKDSGIEWIGEIPVNWKTSRLKDLVEICNGRDYKEFEVEDEGFPVIGSGGEFARSSKYLYNRPSLLLGRKGTVDKPLFVNSPFWTVDTMFYTKIKQNAIAKYLYYYSLCFLYDYYMTSTALPSMTQNDLGSIKIAIPYINEQQAIANFLDDKCKQIDSIISRIEKQIDLLKEHKNSLITETVTRGLDDNIPMKDSGIKWIGNIPASWEVKRLKYISNVHSSRRIFEHEYVDEGIPFFRTKEIVELANNKDISLELFITRSKFNTLKHKRVKKGDILISSIGTIGEVWISDGREFWYKDGNITQIDKNNTFDSQFMRFVILSKVFYESIKYYESTTTISALTIEKIKQIPIPFPSLKKQQTIARYLNKKCKQIDKIMNMKEKQLELIKEHKKSLIFEYVTGKKRVEGYHGN